MSSKIRRSTYCSGFDIDMSFIKEMLEYNHITEEEFVQAFDLREKIMSYRAKQMKSELSNDDWFKHP